MVKADPAARAVQPAAHGPAAEPEDPLPADTAQAAWADSPRLAAQSRAIAAAFGPAAQLQPGPVQLHGGGRGGNPTGRGGKGKHLSGRGARHQVHKARNADELRRRREAIGRHHAKRQDREHPPRRRAAPAAPMAAAAQAPQHGQPVPQHDLAVPQDDRDDLAAAPDPLAVPHGPPLDVGMPAPDEDPREVRIWVEPDDDARPAPQARDDDGAPDVRIAVDAPRDEHGPRAAAVGRPGRRGVGGRIREKMFRGRTFGDASNLLGASANTTEAVSTKAALTVIGSGGVMANGVMLLIEGNRQRREARNRKQKLEAAATLEMGLANLVSGATGIGSGILMFLAEKSLSDTLGVTSTAAWAFSEVGNVLSQALALYDNYQRGAPAVDYIKPLAALTASTIKCIGAALAFFATLDGSTSASGIFLMILGAAISTLHGLIKLFMVLREECGGGAPNERRGNDDPGGPDLELGRA